jgi:hypothetical protein
MMSPVSCAPTHTIDQAIILAAKDLADVTLAPCSV